MASLSSRRPRRDPRHPGNTAKEPAQRRSSRPFTATFSETAAHEFVGGVVSSALIPSFLPGPTLLRQTRRRTRRLFSPRYQIDCLRPSHSTRRCSLPSALPSMLPLQIQIEPTPFSTPRLRCDVLTSSSPFTRRMDRCRRRLIVSSLHHRIPRLRLPTVGRQVKSSQKERNSLRLRRQTRYPDRRSHSGSVQPTRHTLRPFRSPCDCASRRKSRACSDG